VSFFNLFAKYFTLARSNPNPIDTSDPFFSPSLPGKESHRFLLWRDTGNRHGAAHMAMDEALLLQSIEPVLRFYNWPQPEITIGFFTPISEVTVRDEPATRRWTGGGIVEHGEDVTFSLAIPRRFLKKGVPAGERYRQIHEALSRALRAAGLTRVEAAPAISAPPESSPGVCFSAPVAWDVIDTEGGAKLAGGAQRRSKAGLLHQGSVRLPLPYRSLDHPWLKDFASRLAGNTSRVEEIDSPDISVFETAEKLQQDRYASADWRDRF
jgi:lipoate-protein ligase A